MDTCTGAYFILYLVARWIDHKAVGQHSRGGCICHVHLVGFSAFSLLITVGTLEQPGSLTLIKQSTRNDPEDVFFVSVSSACFSQNVPVSFALIRPATGGTSFAAAPSSRTCYPCSRSCARLSKRPVQARSQTMLLTISTEEGSLGELGSVGAFANSETLASGERLLDFDELLTVD